MIRDTQKRKVYHAEVLHSLRQEPLFHDIHLTRDYANRVYRSPWFRSEAARLGDAQMHLDFPMVSVLDGRGCSKGMAWRYRGTIRLPRWCRNRLYVLHELTHLLVHRQSQFVKEPPHGRLFAAVYLRVLRRWAGKEAAGEMIGLFKNHHVHYRPRLA